MCERFQPVPQHALFWCFSLFFFTCSVFQNSCSNILALLFAPAQPKGCFAHAGSAKLPCGQMFCPWVLAASAELVPQVPTSVPSSPKPQFCSDHTHTRNLLESPLAGGSIYTTGNILPLSLCHTILSGNVKQVKQKQPFKTISWSRKQDNPRGIEFFHLLTTCTLYWYLSLVKKSLHNSLCRLCW